MVDLPLANSTPQRLQQVSTIAIRKRIIIWMVQDEIAHGIRGLSIHTINAFLEHFCAQRSANLVRASHWWAQRQQFCNEGEANVTFQPISCSRSRMGKRKQLHTKAGPGCGPKQSEWVLWIYPKLLDAFDWFRKAGVKFSSTLLIELAMSILMDPTPPYTIQSRDPKDNVLLTSKLTPTWVQQFIHVYNIVLLSQWRHLTCSLEKELQIKMATTYHLGVLHRSFQSGVFDENLMENIDETHFVVNFDNSQTLGFKGDTTVKYAEMVSGGDSMTMVIRISEGRRSMIEAPMLIFTNSSNNYPIQGLEDNIPKICYRTQPKGWMDQALVAEFFAEPRAFQADVHNRTKVIWIDNCNIHNMTPRLMVVLEAKQANLRYLLPCSMHLCQLADTFIVSKVKDAWTKQWKAKKVELIATNAWQNTPRADGQWLGKLTNPGKTFFLQLAADSVEDVNKEVNCDNMSYAREAMIRLGMALGVDGTWSVNQLFPHVQEIIAKHEPYF